MWLPWFMVLALLVAVAAFTGGGTSSEPAVAGASAPAAPVPVLAKRVERIRGLRFRSPPRPERVTPEQAKAEGLAVLDREYPPARRRADVAVMGLLGLVPPDTDLRAIFASVYEQQVAGYYDPSSKRLRIVEGPALDNRAYAEIVIAHELTHALEDQRFDLATEDLTGGDDAALAYSALAEGTATALMFEYSQRYLTPEEVLGGLLGSAFGPPTDIPPFLQAQLLWAYTGGQQFVEHLFEVAGDTWTLVDEALRERPPASTEQVLHPEAYLRVEPPLRVRLRAGDALGEGWRRTAAGTLGEWATAELLREAPGTGASDAAAGWGGDRYELWSGPAGDALVVRWAWDTPADRREFRDKLDDYAGAGVASGEAVVGERAGAVTLAVAGDAPTAARLAGAP